MHLTIIWLHQCWSRTIQYLQHELYQVLRLCPCLQLCLSISLLFNSRLSVYSSRNFLHHICQGQFIDTPEFESSVSGEEKYQVSSLLKLTHIHTYCFKIHMYVQRKLQKSVKIFLIQILLSSNTKKKYCHYYEWQEIRWEFECCCSLCNSSSSENVNRGLLVAVTDHSL